MTEMSGEDASVMAATQKILSLGPAAWGEEAPATNAPPKRENRLERDPIERETSTDLAESEEEEAQASAEQKADAKATEPADAAADFIEIPGEEGQEAEKVPLSEAVEAIKQVRALQGDIAAAVNKAEAEYQEKVDSGLSEMARVYDAIVQRAQTVIQSMPVPQPPDRSLIREDPEAYEILLRHYEQSVGLYQSAQRQAQEALTERAKIEEQQLALRVARENERLSRYIPEWKDEKTRSDLESRMTAFMKQTYGLDEKVLNEVTFDHRLVRAMHELMTLKSMQTKAPEVRKAVQEKAPKLTKAAPPQARTQDGKFASNAAERLKQTGAEDDAARLFLSDPRFKSLFA